MSTILEVDDTGTLRVPTTLLPVSQPHTRYIAIAKGKKIVISPEKEELPFWKRASKEEWLDSFNAWISSHSDGPGLPDEAVTRDSIYD